jgi:hypothetical protein
VDIGRALFSSAQMPLEKQLLGPSTAVTILSPLKVDEEFVGADGGGLETTGLGEHAISAEAATIQRDRIDAFMFRPPAR